MHQLRVVRSTVAGASLRAGLRKSPRPGNARQISCFSAANLPLNPRCARHMPAYTRAAKSKGLAGRARENALWLACWPIGWICMEDLLLEYLPILIFIGLAAVLGGVLMVVPLVIAPSKPDPEKLSAYECGFPAFGDARMKFDVRFYLVAILFIIFDLEVAFLFPWAITLTKMGSGAVFAFWSMMVFLGILTVGFIYEWKKGALEWE
jgi:NADH-quinone oxidoreductase subunit A